MGSSKDGFIGELQNSEDSEKVVASGKTKNDIPSCFNHDAVGSKTLKRNSSHQHLEQMPLHKDNNDKFNIHNHDPRSRNKYVKHAHITLHLSNVGDLSSTSTSSSKFLSADNK